ncbi:Cytoplasmic tRNA 2-thiolation protein 2 [Dirofilaria immitis]|nr:Cytoplasmic tRNA 2-thiolation protein 2 [Dirofilaria immitis]
MNQLLANVKRNCFYKQYAIAASEMSLEMRKCVKCPQAATLCGVDVKKAAYCKPCFIQMVKHKFSSAIGKRRLYKWFTMELTLVHFLLSLVSQGLQADAHKRLTLVPTVMVLFKETDERIIDNIKKEIELIKGCILAPWIYVHIAAISQWTQLLTSCSSLSTREEIEYLCSNMLCIRIAQKLGIHKVMLSTSADELASTTLSSLALARGPSVFHSVNVVDKRHSDVTLIRPFREINEKETALINRFEGSDRYILNVRKNRIKVDDDNQSLQSVSRDFISDLMVNGFTGTVTTILSTANKMQAPVTSKTRCVLCSSSYDAKENERFCFSCASVLDQVGDRILLQQLLNSMCMVVC